MASKQLLHDIRNPICYLLITSTQLRSSPTPNWSDKQPSSQHLQESQGPLPSHNSSLFVLMGLHNHLTQLEDTDVSQGCHCFIEQMFFALWIWASCFISRYQRGTLNSKGMIMDLQMALCHTKSIIFQRYYGFCKWNYIHLVACPPSLYSTVFIMIKLLPVTLRQKEIGVQMKHGDSCGQVDLHLNSVRFKSNEPDWQCTEMPWNWSFPLF